MSYEIDARGLDAFTDMLQALGNAVVPAAERALNDTADYARALGSRNIRRKFNLKAGYLQGRLQVAKQARAGDLESIVRGRDRPTSLARFAQGTPSFGKQRNSPRVRVKTAGGSQVIRNGFFMRLKRGSSIISEENANIGIAIRLAEGERVNNKNVMVPIARDLYLLYGPSVGQIYRTEAERTVDQVGDHLAERFAQQLTRAL